ncbi:MAG: chaperone modulator CbpM [Alkalispirochaeta sp.]
MDTHRFIELRNVSERLRIDFEVCRQFADFGIVATIAENNTLYVHPEDVPTLCHAVSLYRDLGVNKEGIDVILRMRERIVRLQQEVEHLTRRTDRLEQENFQKNVELPRQRGVFFEF